MKFSREKLALQFLLVLTFLFFVVFYPRNLKTDDSPTWITAFAEGGESSKKVTPLIRRIEKHATSKQYFTNRINLPGERARKSEQTGLNFVIQDSPASPSDESDHSENFLGFGDTGYYEPDPILTAGPDHLIASINASFAIFSKDGKKLYETTFRRWFRGIDEIEGAEFSQPRVLYDRDLGHFLILVSAQREADRRSWFLLSASRTSNPLADWGIWAFDMAYNGATLAAGNYATYPSIGMDARHLYLSGNMFFAQPERFAYSKLRLLKKAEIYTLQPAGWYDLWNMRDGEGAPAFTLQPAQTTLRNRAYLVSCNYRSGKDLTLWELRSGSSDKPVLMKRRIAVPSFEVPPAAQQQGGGVPVYTGDNRISSVVQSDNSIYAIHTVSHDWGKGPVSALRLYELSTDGLLLQSITFGRDQYYYFFPALISDRNGNLLIAFNRSGRSEYISLRYSARLANDPPGILQQSSLLAAGGANYQGLDGTTNRWGIYTGIAIDTHDDSFWIHGAYPVQQKQWRTQISRIQLSK